MLSINKTFVRKITLGLEVYLVEQNKNRQSITITNKKTKEVLYDYKDGKAFYEIEIEPLIELIFEMAHIDRYILSDI